MQTASSPFAPTIFHTPELDEAKFSLANHSAEAHKLALQLGDAIQPKLWLARNVELNEIKDRYVEVAALLDHKLS